MEAPDDQVMSEGVVAADVERAGVLLRTSAVTLPANAVFTPEELTLRLAAHAARIRREYAEYLAAGGVPDEDTPADATATSLENLKLPPKPDAGRSWQYEELCFVDCAGCQKQLLAPKHEFIRRAAFERRMVCYGYFPPKVKGRVNDRPVCYECYDVLRGDDGKDG